MYVFTCWKELCNSITLCSVCLSSNYGEAYTLTKAKQITNLSSQYTKKRSIDRINMVVYSIIILKATTIIGYF
jgi:hypothetical protein